MNILYVIEGTDYNRTSYSETLFQKILMKKIDGVDVCVVVSNILSCVGNLPEHFN